MAITKKRVRKLWAAALRSKKYGWGTGKLHPRKDEFCCLGVLCELAKDHGVVTRYVATNDYLSKKVQDWVGLATKDGAFKDKKRRSTSLAQINDFATKTPFAEIADIIESEPEGLFI